MPHYCPHHGMHHYECHDQNCMQHECECCRQDDYNNQQAFLNQDMTQLPLNLRPINQQLYQDPYIVQVHIFKNIK